VREYREDLAYIHDSGFCAVSQDAARRLLVELAELDRASGTVVDLGCGSGVLASDVMAAGYDVIGIDVSDAMLALARTRAPKATFRVGSFVGADLPVSVAVTAIGEVINYAFDSGNDDRARADLFGRVYRALIPGGVFLFDVASPDRARRGLAQSAYATGPDWAVLVETAVEPDTGVLTRHITSFRQVGTLYRRDVEVHRLVLLDPGMVRQQLKDAGFDVQSLSAYGTVPLPTGVVAILGRKPFSEGVCASFKHGSDPGW
jgi:SAM-dependent methyltransferase